MADELSRVVSGTLGVGRVIQHGAYRPPKGPAIRDVGADDAPTVLTFEVLG